MIQYNHAVLFKLIGTTLEAVAVCGSQQLEQAVPIHIRLEAPESLSVLFQAGRCARMVEVNSAELPAQFLLTLLKDQAGLLLEDVRSRMWVPLAYRLIKDA